VQFHPGTVYYTASAAQAFSRKYEENDNLCSLSVEVRVRVCEYSELRADCVCFFFFQVPAVNVITP